MRKRNYEEIIKAALPEILTKSSMIIEARAKEMAPVDLGVLRSSIYSEIDFVKNTAFVNCIAPEGIYMEFGRPPGKGPPLEAIAPWAKRHGMDPFLVQRSIAKKGIRVGTAESPLLTMGGTYRPFFRPAAHQSLPRIRELISAVIKKEIEKSRV